MSRTPWLQTPHAEMRPSPHSLGTPQKAWAAYSTTIGGTDAVSPG